MECSQKYPINSSSLIPQAFQVYNQALMVNIWKEWDEVTYQRKWLPHQTSMQASALG